MAKIESIDANVFAIDGKRYTKGDYTIDYQSAGGVLKANLKNKYTGAPLDGQPEYSRWDSYTDTDDEKFANEAAFTAAIAAIIAKTGNLDGIATDRVLVTQGTSVTTAVTANGLSGVITTFAQTLAADAENTFTVNNSKVTASSLPLLSVIYPAASNGVPVATVGTVADGSFTIVLTNAGTAALNAAVKIGFAVL